MEERERKGENKQRNSVFSQKSFFRLISLKIFYNMYRKNFSSNVSYNIYKDLKNTDSKKCFVSLYVYFYIPFLLSYETTR